MGTAFSIQKFLIVCCLTGPAQLGIGMSIDMIMYYVFNPPLWDVTIFTIDLWGLLSHKFNFFLANQSEWVFMNKSVFAVFMAGHTLQGIEPYEILVYNHKWVVSSYI